MLKLLLGDPNARKLKRYQPIVSDINLLEEDVAPLSDDQLRDLTREFRQKLANARAVGGSGEAIASRERKLLDEILPQAFAVVREAGKRVLGMRHFDVQLIGGMVLHEGQIAEMKTGEGKTLVATLPAYLNALTGRGVHIVTVNDYLARRDAEWMGQIHRFLGLSVGLIQQDMPPADRQRNYGCDITYATNSELGFDYLRDNMATDIADVVQRDFHYCIIDEVDSILVDEARTPLIISGQIERPQEKYQRATEVAARLERAAEMGKDGIDPEGDYEVDEKQRNVTLTDEGFAKAEQLLGVSDLYNPADPWAHFISNALKAKELFTRDVNYIVRGEDAVIDALAIREDTVKLLELVGIVRAGIGIVNHEADRAAALGGHAARHHFRVSEDICQAAVNPAGVGSALGLLALEFVEFGEDIDEDAEMVFLEALKAGRVMEQDVRIQDVVFPVLRRGFETEFLDGLGGRAAGFFRKGDGG